MGALFFEGVSIYFQFVTFFLSMQHLLSANHKSFLLAFKNCYFFMLFQYNSDVKKGVGHIYSQNKGRVFKKFLCTSSFSCHIHPIGKMPVHTLQASIPSRRSCLLVFTCIRITLKVPTCSFSEHQLQGAPTILGLRAKLTMHHPCWG